MTLKGKCIAFSLASAAFGIGVVVLFAPIYTGLVETLITSRGAIRFDFLALLNLLALLSLALLLTALAYFNSVPASMSRYCAVASAALWFIAISATVGIGTISSIEKLDRRRTIQLVDGANYYRKRKRPSSTTSSASSSRVSS